MKAEELPKSIDIELIITENSLTGQHKAILNRLKSFLEGNTSDNENCLVEMNKTAFVNFMQNFNENKTLKAEIERLKKRSLYQILKEYFKK